MKNDSEIGEEKTPEQLAEESADEYMKRIGCVRYIKEARFDYTEGFIRGYILAQQSPAAVGTVTVGDFDDELWGLGLSNYWRGIAAKKCFDLALRMQAPISGAATGRDWEAVEKDVSMFQDFGNCVITLVEETGLQLCHEKVVRDWWKKSSKKYAK